MSQTRTVKVNFIMNALLSISSVIFPLISFPYVSRILLPGGIGKISFVTSVVSYFSMAAMLGVPIYGIRACAAVRDDKEALSRRVQEIFIINLVMSFIAYAALGISVNGIQKFSEYKELFIIISFTIGLNVIGIEWLYKALEQYTYITVRSLIFKALGLLLMFLFVKNQSDYLIYGAITVITSAGSYVLNFINLRKFIIIKPLGNYNFGQHIKLVFIFFAMSIATMIYTNLDTVMLGLMKGDLDVGYYNAAVKVKGVLIGIVTSLGTVLMPRVSYFICNNKMKEFKAISEKALNFVFVLAIPLTLFFMLFAKESIRVLSGSAFDHAIVPMQIIMPTIFLIGLTNILGIQILVPMKKEIIVLYSECAGAIIDLLLNLYLIPKYSASGAAVGTLVAEIAVFTVQYIALRKLVNPMFVKIQYFKIMFAAFISVASVFWIKSLSFTPFISLLMASVIFFFVYVMVLLILKENMVYQVYLQLHRKIISRSK